MKAASANINGVHVPYLLWLDDTDVLKSNHVLLQIMVQEIEAGFQLTELFKIRAYKMPKDLHWFHQGGCLPNGERSGWHMFEFWSRDNGSIVNECLDLAEDLGLELQIGVFSLENFQELKR